MEQHIAAEIAMDELAGRADRPKRGGKPSQVIHLGELRDWDLTPRDAVADGPRAGPLVQETRPRDAAQGGVEALADRDHLRPATLGVLACQVLSCAPAIDAYGAIVSAALPCAPESIPRDS